MIFKPLETLATIVAGQSPASSTYNSNGDGLPFFQGKADFQEIHPKVRMWCTSAKRKEAEPGDILMSVRAPVGSVNICDQKSIIGRGLSAIRPSKDLDRMFLFYYLKANEKQIDALGTGSTFKAITQATLKKISIPFLPLDDQKRIAHLLGKVKGLINQRKQHLQQLDDLLKSVFLKMFDEFLKDDSDSTLADCLKIQQGFAFKSAEFIEYGVPIIKIGTVNKRFFDYSTLSFIAEGYPEKIRRYEILPGDLLISLTGTVGKEDYGNTCFVPKDSVYPTYLLNQRVGKLICNKGLTNPYFIDAFMTLPKVKSGLLKQNRGVRQANLSNSDIYNIHLSIPPIDLQNQFAAIVEKVDTLKSHYHQSLADLETLCGALSQKAFKGELDLSRVVLPDEQQDTVAEKHQSLQIPEDYPAQRSLELSTPDLSALEALGTPEKRKSTLKQWLVEYIDQIRIGECISTQQFIYAALNKLIELDHDGLFEEWGRDGEPDLTVEDYDNIKALIFEMLNNGSLLQKFDDDNNTIQVVPV